MKTINPYTGEALKSYKELSVSELEDKLALAKHAQSRWQRSSLQERASKLKQVAILLRTHKERCAREMALEMGKPIVQGRGEIEKCAWLCEYIATTAPAQLQPEFIETAYKKAYVVLEPLGVVLAVMPWNFPFWQVIRFIAPALMVGNVGLLKHASNVQGCAHMLEELFLEAGFEKGCFQNLVIDTDAVAGVIKNPIVKAVTLTGSKAAGIAVASIAASVIKKSVLELGGSNALVVFADAAIPQAVATCVSARFHNTGQSCIAGKRLLLHKDIAHDFIKRFVEAVSQLKSGNPLHDDTFIGVMSSEAHAITLEKLMNESLAMGAYCILGGRRDRAYFEPTILTNVTPDMPVFKEETFGPLAAVTTFSTVEEAVALVNNSAFGLGVSLFTQNTAAAEELAPRFKDGAVFINEKVASHPALPFGGTGDSGYGRELSHYGLKEFCNIKTVVVS